MNIAEMSRQVKVSRVKLYEILYGNGNPKESTMLSICNYLKIDPSRFVSLREESRKTLKRLDFVLEKTRTTKEREVTP